MADRHILLVEDEEDIQQLVEYNLLKGGYTVACAADGETALALARADPPDLVLLDLMLPRMDGLDVLRRMKGDPLTDGIPVIILTARGEESDIVRGFELGADDYIAKPFSPRVLMARVSAVLRRGGRPAPQRDGPIRAGVLVIDPQRHEVRAGDRKVALTYTEFRLLHLLASRPGWVFTRNQIINAIHGDDYVVTDRSVDVLVAGLRRRLAEAGPCIETVRGVGYRFRD